MRYLFFYLSTGNGHLAPCQALQSRLEKKGHQVVLFDPLENAHPILRELVVHGYRRAQQYSPWFYSLGYWLTKQKLLARLLDAFLSQRLKRDVRKKLKMVNPDVVLCAHFFIISSLKRAINKHNRTKVGSPARLEVLVTDPFTAHPFWSIQKKLNFIVASERVKSSFLKKGVSFENVKVLPFVLHERYSKAFTSNEVATLKDEFGFRPEVERVLIIGGGDGLKPAPKIIDSIIAKTRRDSETFRQSKQDGFDILCVCGKNETLYKKIRKKYKLYFSDCRVIKGAQVDVLSIPDDGFEIRVYLFKYVSFVKELIAVSSLVISKCGASTFMEVLLTGAVPLISNYIWEQEKGNVEFIIKNNLGYYLPDIDDLSEKSLELIKNKKKIESLQRNISELKLKNGLEEVSQYLERLN